MHVSVREIVAQLEAVIQQHQAAQTELRRSSRALAEDSVASDSGKQVGWSVDTTRRTKEAMVAKATKLVTKLVKRHRLSDEAGGALRAYVSLSVHTYGDECESVDGDSSEDDCVPSSLASSLLTASLHSAALPSASSSALSTSASLTASPTRPWKR